MLRCLPGYAARHVDDDFDVDDVVADASVFALLMLIRLMLPWLLRYILRRCFRQLRRCHDSHHARAPLLR